MAVLGDSLPVFGSYATAVANNGKSKGFRTRLESTRSAGAFCPILKDLHFFESYETTAHHAVQPRQEAIDLVLAIDDLDHQGQIFRKAQDLRGVKSAIGAKTHRTTQNGCAGQMQLPSL